MEISKEVDNYLVLKKHKRVYRSPAVQHPSDLSLCNRHHFYKFKHPEIDYSAKTYRTFQIGNLVHKWLGKVFKEAPSVLVAESEVPLSVRVGKINITGYCDYVIVSASGQIYIIEIKTTSYLKYTPNELHEIQLNFYIKGFMEKSNKDCTGLLYYWDKMKGLDKEYEYKFNEVMWKEMISDAKIVYDCVVKNVLPEKEESWLCKNCIFKHLCDDNVL